MGQYFCENCKRDVEGKKIFHGVAFVLLIIFIWLPIGIIFLVFGFLAVLIGSVGGIIIMGLLWLSWLSIPFIYALYHVFGKTPRCPICNTKLKEERT
jgi:hypothetical protein